MVIITVTRIDCVSGEYSSLRHLNPRYSSAQSTVSQGLRAVSLAQQADAIGLLCHWVIQNKALPKRKVSARRDGLQAGRNGLADRLIDGHTNGFSHQCVFTAIAQWCCDLVFCG
jgi:hypothetical protein